MRLPDTLVADVKRYPAATDQSLSAVTAAALRKYLDMTKTDQPVTRIRHGTP